MHTLIRDFQYAVRRLVRTPGFTAVAALSLALGIGANTAIFSIVNAVLLREGPGRAPERLVELYTGERGGFEYSKPELGELVRFEQQLYLRQGGVVAGSGGGSGPARHPWPGPAGGGV